MANLRPFQVAVLVSFVLLALGGLLVFANFSGFGRSAKDVGTVTIWGTLPQAQVSAGLTELKRLHKEYAKVTYMEYQASTIDTDIANAIASGTGPDLILVSHEHLLAERSRLNVIPYSSISERTFRDGYLPFFELYLTGTGTYGIPVVVDPLMLYYNRTTLSSAGIVNPPSTWEAVTGLAPALTRINAAQTIERSTIALGTYSNIDNARAILSLLFLQAGQGITAMTNQGVRATLSQSGTETYGVTAVESALNFYTEFANPTKTIYSWNRSLPGARDSFSAGDSALYLGFASERPRLAAANPNLDFDMAPVPQPGTASARTTYGRAYAFSIPKASRNASGALEVAYALTGGDVLLVLSRSLSMAPAARAFLTPSNEDLYEPVYYPQALISKGWLSPAPATTDSILAGMIDNVNTGRMNVSQALITANQSLDAAVQ